MKDKQPFRRYYKAWDRRATRELDGAYIVAAIGFVTAILIVASVW